MERAFGRTLAACVHPYAAWRYWPLSARVLLVSAYVTGAYIAVLAALFIRGAAV